MKKLIVTKMLVNNNFGQQYHFAASAKIAPIVFTVFRGME
jgi:hypothetical protein